MKHDATRNDSVHGGGLAALIAQGIILALVFWGLAVIFLGTAP